MIDNGGRRSRGDRRTFSYGVHLPERRTGKDRRDGFERRSKYFDQRDEIDLKNGYVSD